MEVPLKFDSATIRAKITETVRPSGAVTELIENDMTRNLKKYNEVADNPAKDKRMNVPVRQHVEYGEFETLTNLFPEFQLSYSTESNQPHSYLAASRNLEGRVLYMRAFIDNSQMIVDVGGNWQQHVACGRANVHSCCPALDIRDAARDVERTINFEKMIGREQREHAALNDSKAIDFFSLQHSTNRALKKAGQCCVERGSLKKGVKFEDEVRSIFRCTKRVEDCDVVARTMIALHSVYDISIKTLAKAMTKHKSLILHGCFLFHPTILVVDRGAFGVGEGSDMVHFVKDEQQDTITFTFTHDMSQGYIHRYSNYIKYVNTTHVRAGGHYFYYELGETRGPTQFFKMVAVGTQCFRLTGSEMRVWFAASKDKVVVRLFDYAALACDNPVLDLTVREVIFERAFVERAMGYAMTLSDANLTRDEVFKYLRSLNYRTMINGMVATESKGHLVDEVYQLATVVLVRTMMSRYRQAQVYGRLKDNEYWLMNRRKLGTLQLVIRGWRRFSWKKQDVHGDGIVAQPDIFSEGGSFRKWWLSHDVSARYKLMIREASAYISFEDWIREYNLKVVNCLAGDDHDERFAPNLDWRIDDAGNGQLRLRDEFGNESVFEEAARSGRESISDRVRAGLPPLEATEKRRIPFNVNVDLGEQRTGEFGEFQRGVRERKASTLKKGPIPAVSGIFERRRNEVEEDEDFRIEERTNESGRTYYKLVTDEVSESNAERRETDRIEKASNADSFVGCQSFGVQWKTDEAKRMTIHHSTIGRDFGLNDNGGKTLNVCTGLDQIEIPLGEHSAAMIVKPEATFNDAPVELSEQSSVAVGIDAERVLAKFGRVRNVETEHDECPGISASHFGYIGVDTLTGEDVYMENRVNERVNLWLQDVSPESRPILIGSGGLRNNAVGRLTHLVGKRVAQGFEAVRKTFVKTPEEETMINKPFAAAELLLMPIRSPADLVTHDEFGQLITDGLVSEHGDDEISEFENNSDVNTFRPIQFDDSDVSGKGVEAGSLFDDNANDELSEGGSTSTSISATPKCANSIPSSAWIEDIQEEEEEENDEGLNESEAIEWENLKKDDTWKVAATMVGLQLEGFSNEMVPELAGKSRGAIQRKKKAFRQTLSETDVELLTKQSKLYNFGYRWERATEAGSVRSRRANAKLVKHAKKSALDLGCHDVAFCEKLRTETPISVAGSQKDGSEVSLQLRAQPVLTKFLVGATNEYVSDALKRLTADPALKNMREQYETLTKSVAAVKNVIFDPKFGEIPGLHSENDMDKGRYICRSAFKLFGIHDAAVRNNAFAIVWALTSISSRVLDLSAAPGSWLQMINDLTERHVISHMNMGVGEMSEKRDVLAMVYRGPGALKFEERQVMDYLKLSDTKSRIRVKTFNCSKSVFDANLDTSDIETYLERTHAFVKTTVDLVLCDAAKKTIDYNNEVREQMTIFKNAVAIGWSVLSDRGVMVVKAFFGQSFAVDSELLLFAAAFFSNVSVEDVAACRHTSSERYLVLSNPFANPAANDINRCFEEYKVNMTAVGSHLMRQQQILFEHCNTSRRRLEVSEALNTVVKQREEGSPVQTKVTVERACAAIKEMRSYWSKEIESVHHTCSLHHKRIISANGVDFTKLQAVWNVDRVRILRLTDAKDKAYEVVRVPGRKEMSECEEYAAGHDGEEFIPLKYIPGITRHRIDWREGVPLTRVPTFLVVTKQTKLIQAPKLLDATAHLVNEERFRTRYVLVEGVPGCGKTTEIIRRLDKNDLFLTVARETKEEAIEKVHLAGKKTHRVRTIDSFLIHGPKENRKRRNEGYDNVFVDEALMVHEGVLHCLAYLTKAKTMYLFGDRNQIPFINRLDMRMRFSSLNVFDEFEYRNVSYRCPLDVVSGLQRHYKEAGGFFTANTVDRSLKISMRDNAHAAIEATRIHEKDSMILTLTQDEKASLITAGIKTARTVHEVQGKTARKVVVVRLKSTDIELFRSKPHVIVAMTRHTHEFHYVTVFRDKQKDLIARTVFDSQQLLSDLRKAVETTHNKDIHTVVVAKPIDDTPPVIQPVRVPDIASPLTALQTFYDQALPSSSCAEMDFDAYQVQFSPTELNMDVTMTLLDKPHVGARMGPSDEGALKSKLRTAQPAARPHTQKETLLALLKRNANVTPLRENVDVLTSSAEIVDKFFDSFAVPHWRDICAEYQVNTLRHNDELVLDWINRTEPAKLKAIEQTGQPLETDDICRYYLELKKEPKNKLEVGAHREYLALQTIVRHSRRVNSVFSPIFGQIMERLDGILKPNVCFMQRKNLAQIERHINANLIRDEQGHHTIEVDFSKFDKSQELLTLLVELRVFVMLGLDPTLAMAWMQGHESTYAKDFMTGIAIVLNYQRKSGDATTCLGNTIVSMATISYCFDLKEMVASYFVGDDSVIFFEHEAEVNDGVEMLGRVCNLDAKVIKGKGYAYFCSSFIVFDGDVYRMVPDPLKKVEKLGKAIKVKQGQSNEDAIHERWVSFADTMSGLKYFQVHRPLSLAVKDRYSFSGSGADVDCAHALCALNKLAGDFGTFREIYHRTASGNHPVGLGIKQQQRRAPKQKLVFINKNFVDTS